MDSIVDSVSNIFSSGAGAAAETAATSDVANNFFGGADSFFGSGATTNLVNSGAAGASDFSAFLPTIGSVAGTSAGSSGGGDLSAFGGSSPIQSEALSAPSSAPGGGTFPSTPGSNGGPRFGGGPGGISGISTAPTASATPAATLGGAPSGTGFGAGTSAAAARAPGDFGGGGQLGDLKNLDPNNLNTGTTAFGSQQTPDQALLGKPDVPDAGGGASSGASPAAHGPTNSLMDAIRNPNADSILNAIGNNSGALLGGGMLASQLFGATAPGAMASSNVGSGPANGSPGIKLQDVPTTTALATTGANLNAAATPLIAGPTTGTLPPGLQSAIDQASAAQKAHIRSQYAGMGLSGSTMEQQAMNQVDMAAEQQKADQIQKLVSTGLDETRLSTQIYQELQKAQLAGDKELSQALSNFAAAVGGAGVPRQQAA